ncbi:DUF1127 domain-containing protein [Aestuariivirga sp.]|uniref:DUF1127 domain-containing protein n=1 Tax=Aestuariivirga sp. TaxID=2650926 RepID=UPI003593CE54
MTAHSAALSQLALGLSLLIRPFRRKKAAAQLSELDDHLLKDIGLTRFDVNAMRRMW